MAPIQKPGRSKQDYCTPPEFLKAVKARLHIIDFVYDLAASKENTVAPLWYDEAANSLIQNWVWDGWCWCNPPFAHIEPWVEKAANEAMRGAQIAMLVPASVGSNWWWTWVEPNAYQTYLNGRLAFMPDKPKWLYPKDCALLLYHPWGFVGHELWHWRNMAEK